jgi:hypothetical protein
MELGLEDLVPWGRQLNEYVRIFQLTPEQVRTPFGVQVVQVSPATVAISFEPSKTRTVRVTPKIEGQPDTGFVMGSVTVTPSTVEVVGPASSVSRVTEAVTEPVTIAGGWFADRDRHHRILDPAPGWKRRARRR